MNWSCIEIAGKPADLFVPHELTKPLGVVLFLHGYDGVTVRDNETYTREFEKHNLIAICPAVAQCWWTNTIDRSFHDQISPIEYLARHIPEYCRDTWHIEPPRIAICGNETGGQGALQLAYRHARQFPLIVAISPKVDFETWWGLGTSLDDLFENRESARQQTAILHVHPLNYPRHQLILCDPADRFCFDGVLTLASKLSSTGIPFDQDFETSHGGHGWDYVNSMASQAINYIAAKLQTH